MFCRKCGNKLPGNALFCPKCGTRITQQTGNPQMQGMGYAGPVAPENKNLKKWYVLIGIMTAIFVMLVVMIFVSLLGGDDKKEAPKNDGTVGVETSETESESAKKAPFSEESTGAADEEAEENTAAETEDFNGYVEKSQDEVNAAMAAYADYIRSSDHLGNSWESYDVIYLNNDNLPEIILEGNCEAAGNVVLYMQNGVVQEVYLARLGFGYHEYTGYLCNSDGHMGYFYDRVYYYDPENGMQLVGDGEFTMSQEEMVKENGVCDYTWNGEAVSENQYYEKLKSIYDYSERTETYYRYASIEDAAAAVRNQERGNSLYVIPGENYRYYTEADLAGLSKDELAIARNEIYARNGYIFTTQKWIDYFSGKPWYSPYRTEVREDDMSDMERANLKLILREEEK